MKLDFDKEDLLNIEYALVSMLNGLIRENIDPPEAFILLLDKVRGSNKK